MKKFIFSLLLGFYCLFSFSQNRGNIYTVKNDSAAFGVNMSAATLVLDASTKQLYFLNYPYLAGVKLKNTDRTLITSNGITDSNTFVPAVIGTTNKPLVAPLNGSRYIAELTLNGWTKNNIYEYDSVQNSYIETVVSEGFATIQIDSANSLFTFNGTKWVKQGYAPQLWVSSGTNMLNTNTGAVLVGVSSQTYPTNKFEVRGNSYFNGSLIQTGELYTARVLSENGFVHYSFQNDGLKFSTSTTLTKGVDITSGTTQGGRIRLYTKGNLALGIDSNQYVQIGAVKYPKARGISGQVLIKSAGDSAYWATAASSSSANWGKIQVLRKAKNDTTIATSNIDILADTTVFLPADSNIFNFMGGNYVATKNIFTRTSRYYAEYPTKIRTTGAFVLFDATGINTNQLIIEGHFYGQCDYGFIEHFSNRANVKYSILIDSCISTNKANLYLRNNLTKSTAYIKGHFKSSYSTNCYIDFQNTTQNEVSDKIEISTYYTGNSTNASIVDNRNCLLKVMCKQENTSAMNNIYVSDGGIIGCSNLEFINQNVAASIGVNYIEARGNVNAIINQNNGRLDVVCADYRYGAQSFNINLYNVDFRPLNSYNNAVFIGKLANSQINVISGSVSGNNVINFVGDITDMVGTKIPIIVASGQTLNLTGNIYAAYGHTISISGNLNINGNIINRITDATNGLMTIKVESTGYVRHRGNYIDENTVALPATSKYYWVNGGKLELNNVSLISANNTTITYGVYLDGAYNLYVKGDNTFKFTKSDAVGLLANTAATGKIFYYGSIWSNRDATYTTTPTYPITSNAGSFNFDTATE